MMGRICTVPDCGKPHKAHGYCGRHSQAFQAHGDPLGKAVRVVKICASPDCERPVHAKGLCTGHYQRTLTGYGSGTLVARSSADAMQEFHEAVLAIVEEQQPMTVRQVYYQATVKDLVEKTERGYIRVQRALVAMRRDDRLPYDWLIDNTRTRHRPYTLDSVQDALEDAARTYRKSLWGDIDAYVEIWLEKDALAGVIKKVTDARDVSLMVTRGYGSLSFLYEAAEEISGKDVPVHIYHLGDFDPSGVNAGEKIEETLREMAPDADITFERLAVTKEQIAEWNLPTRLTKSDDPRARDFGDISVELDAIRPDDLRDLVQKAIERHMPPEEFKALKAAERREQRSIKALVELVEEQGLADEIEDDEGEGEGGVS